MRRSPLIGFPFNECLLTKKRGARAAGAARLLPSSLSNCTLYNVVTDLPFITFYFRFFLNDFFLQRLVCAMTWFSLAFHARNQADFASTSSFPRAPTKRADGLALIGLDWTGVVGCLGWQRPGVGWAMGERVFFGKWELELPATAALACFLDQPFQLEIQGFDPHMGYGYRI